MLDEIVSAFASDLAGRKTATMRYRTIGLASFLVGLLFFVALLVEELAFSDRPLSMQDMLVLTALALLISALIAAILSYAKWHNERCGKQAKPTT